MLSAAAVHSLTPADLETRLTALGVPIARLIAAARIARSTWSDWRAGRTRPRPDRWSAVTEAFAALVAEAEAAPPAAPPEVTRDDVVSLAGSSAPTGARPSFTPVADSDTAGIGSRPGHDVEVAAERVIALAAQEWAALSRDVEADDRAAVAPNPRRIIAARAACRRCRRFGRRLRRATVALAEMPARSPAEVAAKARAVLAIPNATVSDPWWAKLRDGAIQEAAELDRTSLVAGPVLSQPLPGIGGLTASEGPAFVAVARNWAWSDMMLMSAIKPTIEVGSVPRGNLDALHDVEAACRDRFLATPARTLDGVLAKSLVLSTFIQTEDDASAACFVALQGATRNTAEARFAFSVMKDLAAMSTERGITVEGLAALPAGDARPERDETARLSAEWSHEAAWETRMRHAMGDLISPSPRYDRVLEEARQRSASYAAVLRRLADHRCSDASGLALKAAAVVAACNETGLDRFIIDAHVDDLGEMEHAVALSLVRDVFDMLGAPARRLADAALHPAEMPVAGEPAPLNARAAA